MGVVSQRLAMYQEAVRAAEENGESSKARRYKRGLTTLEQVIRVGGTLEQVIRVGGTLEQVIRGWRH